MFDVRCKQSQFFNGLTVCVLIIICSIFYYKTKLFEEYFLINICQLLTTIPLTVLMLFSGGSNGPETDNRKESMNNWAMAREVLSSSQVLLFSTAVNALEVTWAVYTLVTSSSGATQRSRAIPAYLAG